MRIIIRKGTEGHSLRLPNQARILRSDCCHRRKRPASDALRVLKCLVLVSAIMVSLTVTAFAQPVPVWEMAVGYFFVNTPAMGDVDGDGEPDIVVTASGSSLEQLAVSTTGIVTVVNSDGIPLPGWPVITDDQVGLQPPTPATVFDLDGDGRAEILFGHGHTLSVLSGDGRLLWQKRVEGFLKRKPEVADLDGDGRFEIISSADQFLGQARVYVWRLEGQAYPGTPFMLDEFFASSLSVYQSAGHTLMAVGGGNGYTGEGGSLYLFAPSNGTLRLQWQRDIGQHPIAKPVFSDVNGDGIIDIVGGTYAPSVYAVSSSDGQFLHGWPRLVRGGVFTSPAVFQDGKQTIVLAVTLGGTLYAWDDQGRLLWTIAVDPNAVDQMTLGDINGDGTREVVLGVNGGVVAVSMNGLDFNYWELGDYWVTGTIVTPQRSDGTSRLVLGGVNNYTEEAKLFSLNLPRTQGSTRLPSPVRPPKG
jgi:hypothetical protein